MLKSYAIILYIKINELFIKIYFFKKNNKKK